jgi:hypothetical protein
VDAVEVLRAIVADDARLVRDRVPPMPLPYGEVRIGPGGIAIGFESVTDLSPVQRTLYEQAVAATGVDPEDVLVVRIGEAGIEVDAIDRDDVCWPVRTLRVTRRVVVDGPNAPAAVR